MAPMGKNGAAGLSPVSERVKQVRKALQMSQRDFSRLLALSHTYIGGVESGFRGVNDRLVKLIVAEFGVNEAWLRGGEGEMFADNQDEQFVKLTGLYRELPAKYRNLVVRMMEILLEMRE
jgi:transcriptional regulator with XRE-family HTH domain